MRERGVPSTTDIAMYQVGSTIYGLLSLVIQLQSLALHPNQMRRTLVLATPLKDRCRR